jgi:hypothetical protein
MAFGCSYELKGKRTVTNGVLGLNWICKTWTSFESKQVCTVKEIVTQELQMRFHCVYDLYFHIY